MQKYNFMYHSFFRARSFCDTIPLPLVFQVVINKRQIHLDDKDKLPYVQAFLREVLRYAAVGKMVYL